MEYVSPKKNFRRIQQNNQNRVYKTDTLTHKQGDMEYKQTAVNTHMTLQLAETCKSKPNLRGVGSMSQGHRSGNKETNFHGITIRPRGGVTDQQIKLVIKQAIHDCGRMGLAVRATIGIEGKGIDRHVHVSEVLVNPARHKAYGREDPKSKTWSRYAKLLEGTYDKTFCTEDKNKAIHVWQPGKTQEEHMTQFRFLAYPLKNLAKGPDGEAILPNLDGQRTGEFASIGLFEGLDETETEEAKLLLSKAIFRTWRDKLQSQKQIVIDGSRKFWRVDYKAFYEEHCTDIANTKANRPEIIARMFQYADVNKSYHFSDYFINKAGPNVNLYLNGLDPEDDAAEIHRAVVEYVTIVLEKVKPPSRKRKATSTETTALHQKIKQLKTELAGAKSTIEELNKTIETNARNYQHQADYRSQQQRKMDLELADLRVRVRNLQNGRP